MNKDLSILKNEFGITNIFSIEELNNKNKIYLFHNQTERVNYSVCTDGILQHTDTWIDKWPSKLDSFLEECFTCKRFEFKLSNANIVLLEKKKDNKLMRNLYINENEILKVLNKSMYCVTITEKEKIMIKKMEDMFWK